MIHYKIQTIVQTRIKRAYCRWALSKKKKKLEALTQFEKKFISVLKRICLMPDSEFNYSYREDAGRIVSNASSNVTIQIKGAEIKFFDSEMITVFFTTPDVADYVSSIFDRATDIRAARKSESVYQLQLSHIRKVEGTLMTHNRPSRESGPPLRPKVIGKTLEIIAGD